MNAREFKSNLDPPKKRILFIQMEYATTKTLRSVIDDGIEDEDEVWRLFRQIVEGLDHVLSFHLIHVIVTDWIRSIRKA